MKKLKTNQNGIAHVGLILLTLVVISAVGFAGWRVWDKKQDGTTSDTTTTAELSDNKKDEAKNEKCDSTDKKIESEKIGIQFCYPASWKSIIIDTPKDHIVGTVTLTSPDYKEETEMAYGGSKTGSKLYISVYDISKLGDKYTSVASILDGTEKSTWIYSEVKAVKIASKDGAMFKVGYEGPELLTTTFEYNGNAYSVALEQDIDGPEFNANQDQYQKIVDSFKLTTQ